MILIPFFTLALASFLELGKNTNRGFDATSAEREEVKRIVDGLVRDGGGDRMRGLEGLRGDWTLIYTDAPDITSLANNPVASLGRIGQNIERTDGTDDNFYEIKNCIEWMRPSNFPNPLKLPRSLIGEGKNSRVIQKVVTRGAQRSAEEPFLVDLVVRGVEILPEEADGETLPLPLRLLKDLSLPSQTIFSDKLPFGSFELLYLDSEFRIIKTSNNHLAANVRVSDEERWF